MSITKIDLENNKKPNEKICDFIYVENGVDENNFPTFEIKYINPPTSYTLVKLIEPLKVAILEIETTN